MVYWFGGGANKGDTVKLGKLPGGFRRPMPENPVRPAGGDSLPMRPPALVPGRAERIAPEVDEVVPPEVDLMDPGATMPPAGMADVAPAGTAGAVKETPVGLVLLT